MNTRCAALATLCFLIACVTDARAQGRLQWRGGGGWGPGGHYGRLYDPKTVATLTGGAVTVDQLAPEKGMGHGVHLLLKTGTETISVHLGPAWYVEHQDTTIEPKDKIEVKGSRVMFYGKRAVIAGEGD